MYENFLPLVSKPARYINSEINAVHKDHASVATRVCLFFPDAYEVGMSHLGLRILYDILNKRPDTVCERVFSPWPDYEQRLRSSGGVLKSLETNVPVANFDLVGITLQYELSYTNVLAGLDLAGIPLRSADRNDSHPVVVAGGPCAVNPEPLADFIDVFFIGEAEEAVQELVELRQRHTSRKDLFEALSKQDGFFVPSLGKQPVRRRFLQSIDRAPYPDTPLLPLMKPIHDRVTVEIARGCIRGCRFCQAGIIYRPYRERSSDRIKGLLEESLRCTGYDELSLASLSAGDHSEIQPLVVELMEAYRDSRVSVSLPSLRVGTLTPGMITAIAATRKTGFTLAPEAGTERLRRVINKPVSDIDLLDAAETIFRSGWSVLKLYFMIGLPSETSEDLDGIVRIANEILNLGKRTSKRHIQINVSVSTFVPKPHTPFQWLAQAPIDDVRAKQAYLAKGLRRRGITLKAHDPETSLLEGVFARGDRALGRVIEAALRAGCRFDGWSEHFDFQRWTAVFTECGIDPAAYASKTFNLDDELPWSHVKTGVTGKFLQSEYKRAMAAETTDNCRVSCEHCGIGCSDGGSETLGRPAASDKDISPDKGIPRPAGGKAAVPDHAIRIRLKYSKTGRLRFLSHLDFMTMVHRAVVRSGTPIAYSQGFNPHPRISFGPALPVGMESDSEFFDMETSPFVNPAEIAAGLNSVLPQEVRILDARTIPMKAASLSGGIGRYVYEILSPQKEQDRIGELISGLLASTALIVTKEGKQKDIRPGIEAIETADRDGASCLRITLIDQDQIKPRIQDVLEKLFCFGPEEGALVRTKRVGMFCRDGDQWKSPMDV